jgi:UDP-N-acetylmuramoyl-L-alanyl-D-glutamate--2,6-diaminopimelate ligase
MRLAELVGVADAVAGPARLEGPGDTAVADVGFDSRNVTPGMLYCCVPGHHVDGHDFAPEAVRAGASAVVVERPLDPDTLVPTGASGPVGQLVVASVRRAMGPLAAAVHNHPADHLDVVGITGTNGKTTTTQLLAAALSGAGVRTEVLGTLTGARTTPEGPDLQRTLAAWQAAGTSVVAMEVSSHALDQHRVDGTRFRVAAFTNLSPDHLDYHPDLEAYFQAKARLFTEALCDEAVICVDDAAGRRLADEVAAAGIGVTRCSVADATGVRSGPDGSVFTWQGVELRVALAGRHNVANAVVAATVARVLGVSASDIARGLATLAGVPGRFEMVACGQPFTVVVDFAHTPDALDSVLAAARTLTPDGRVLVVFGCGGERDPHKRPEMGRVAAEGADVVVATADNSRSESTGAIIDDVLRGIAGVPGGTDRCVIHHDRRNAISTAVELAAPGDVVVIAGRGHETELTIGSTSVPFSDREVVAAELAARGWTA